MSDYKPGSDEDLCSYIQLEDLSKAWIFFNNECIETYKTCEDYQGDNIKKEICESIYTTREKKRIHSLDLNQNVFLIVIIKSAKHK